MNKRTTYPALIFSYALCIVLFCLTVYKASAQPANVQECRNELNYFNKIQTGIPENKIEKYEKCVSEIEDDFVKTRDANDKNILNTSYHKLISFFESMDNEGRKEKYQKKLKALK